MCNDLVISHGEPIEHNATFSAKEWTWHRISTSCSLFHATRSPGSVKTFVPVGHSIFDDPSSRRRCISLILSNDHSLSRQCKLGSSEFRRAIVNANWWGLRAGYMQNGWNTVESAKPVDGGAAEELTRRTTSRKNFADFYFISSALRLVPPTAIHQKDKRYWKLALFCQLLCQSCNQKSKPLLILTRWCRVVAQGATIAGQSNVECDFSSPHCCSAGNSDAVAHSGGCCHQIVGRDNKLRKANNILIFAGNCRRHRMKEFRTECSNFVSRVFSRLASQCMVGPNKLSGEDKQIGIIKPHNRQIKNLHALPKPTEIEQFAALPLLVPGFRGGSISHLLCCISLRPFVHFVWHAKRRSLFPVWYLAVISFRWELAELN